MYKIVITFLYLWGWSCVSSQENAGSSVANSLIECYNNTNYLTKDLRLPSTINVLIELIRKIEDGPTTLDSRQLSYQLIHRFRQDGIVKSSKSNNLGFSLPYSPIGKQSDKNRILLQKMIPGNAVNFPNETLNALERCSLHFMLSNTIELAKRGDESVVCNKLSKYRQRLRRDINDDVEVFKVNGKGSKQDMQDDPNEQGTEEDNVNVSNQDAEEFDGPNTRTVSEQDISMCPVEGGVVYTKWGAIQSGTVIAGIASGYEKQEINTRMAGFKVDNRFGSTLIGDLSEAALHQGSVSDVVNVGVNGGWNNTIVPHWYFINKKEDWEITDADIRAGLDGLILALNIDNWKKYNIKVSQILDLYYSSRGVFSTSIRACNRRELQTTVAPTETLVYQTQAFNDLLDIEAKLKGTIQESGLKILGEKVVQNFLTYLPNMNDLSCAVESETIERAATDILIILDTAWPYHNIQPALSYFLDNLDINKYGSNYTIVNAIDFRTIVQSSRTILDFHEIYNLTVHQSHPSGIDLNRVYNEIESFMRSKMNNETTIVGKSTIILLVPYTTTITNENVYFINQRKTIFKQQFPDLRLMVLGSGSKDIYSDLVFDSAYDVFTLPDTTDAATIQSSIKACTNRIKEIPRKIVNPNCKADWTGTVGSHTLQEYVEPGSVNYYRVAPNYFFSDTDTEENRSLKLRGQGYGTVTVCYSKSIPRPRQNDTSSSDIICESINSNEITINLKDHCSGFSYISDCPPLYFSVDATQTKVTNYRCTDSGCRFPDNLKYTIATENFGCASGSMRILGSFILIGFIFTILQF